jgi:hypothetical protein
MNRLLALGFVSVVLVGSCDWKPKPPPPTTTTTVPSTTTVAPTTTAPVTTTSTSTATTQPATTTTVAPTTSVPSSASFVETFNGPASPAPVPFTDPRWTVTAYTRDLRDTGSVFPTHAEHSDTCGPPPATHHVTDPANLVFLCGADDNRHLMTSINGREYGQVALTPNVTLDFTTGGVVEWDVSSFFSSERDWWDVWILPAGDTRKIICDESYQDTPGFGDCFLPRDGIHVKPQTWENESPAGLDRVGIETWVYRDGVGTLVNTELWRGVFDLFAPSAVRRDTYRLELAPSSLSTCLPDYGYCYADAVTFPTLGWSTGTVHFVHHSYNATKDDTFPNGQAAGPGTWHFDNVLISPTS